MFCFIFSHLPCHSHPAVSKTLSRLRTMPWRTFANGMFFFQEQKMVMWKVMKETWLIGLLLVVSVWFVNKWSDVFTRCWLLLNSFTLECDISNRSLNHVGVHTALKSIAVSGSLKKGGSLYIITQLAIYTTYIPGKLYWWNVILCFPSIF